MGSLAGVLFMNKNNDRYDRQNYENNGQQDTYYQHQQQQQQQQQQQHHHQQYLYSPEKTTPHSSPEKAIPQSSQQYNRNDNTNTNNNSNDKGNDKSSSSAIQPLTPNLSSIESKGYRGMTWFGGQGEIRGPKPSKDRNLQSFSFISSVKEKEVLIYTEEVCISILAK
jgi:hypothetical protein